MDWLISSFHVKPILRLEIPIDEGEGFRFTVHMYVIKVFHYPDDNCKKMFSKLSCEKLTSYLQKQLHLAFIGS